MTTLKILRGVAIVKRLSREIVALAVRVQFRLTQDYFETQQIWAAVKIV